ncbi:MAG TPA: hypothetical protein VF980_06195 [Thermoanaerobaculia bacterium]
MRTAILSVLITTSLYAQSWPQWGANAQHDNASSTVGLHLERIQARVVLDPFTAAMEQSAGGDLLAHYAVPLVDGDDVFVVEKSGAFSGATTRETQTWNVVRLRWNGGQLAKVWTFATDWKPVPFGSAAWEPVYHPALNGDFILAPAAGGTIDQLRRSDGSLVKRFNPFATIDPSIFMSGPPVVDSAGNIYYNAIQLDTTAPWTRDPVSSWIVKIAADGTITKATFASLTTDAPRSSDPCTTSFLVAPPWPPTPDAVALPSACGAQRPGINVAPAVAADGTIYTVSRAHQNSRYAYLIAVNPDLTPKWSASMRNRLHDGCNVLLPPNGTPGGCREGTTTGFDPSDNLAGSGRVLDDSSASPVVTPDGSILYGSYTRYNYSQGHLMMFGPNGNFIAAYPFGWDLTPAIYRHDGTYSILLKENHYPVGSYCDGSQCPADRNKNTPNDPEAYYITQLDASLTPEWRFQSANTLSCSRDSNGVEQCSDDGRHPRGFEWCVNAVAVDARGVAYADSEDGNVYAIAQGGTLDSSIFLNLAVGAAYTPTSIGPDGRIYTQNNGSLFVIEQNPKRRAVRRP